MHAALYFHIGPHTHTHEHEHEHEHARKHNPPREICPDVDLAKRPKYHIDFASRLEPLTWDPGDTKVQSTPGSNALPNSVYTKVPVIPRPTVRKGLQDPRHLRARKTTIGPTGRACWGGATRGSTRCYAMVLPGRKSDFRAGFWPDCYRESNDVGLPYEST